MKCPRCQHENPAGQKFCGDCGTPLIRSSRADAPEASYADLTAALSEALDRETATSEILRVISGSPTDVQPTFEAIAASATRLCAAEEGTVFSFDGTLIHVAAHCGVVQNNLLRRVFPRPAGPGSVTARAIQTRSVVHIPDVRIDPDLEQSVLITMGFRTVLSLPIVRDGEPIGAITVSRQSVAPFSDEQIALLQTFANQAVIAIENVRLFKELETRNQELATALDQHTTTSEILRVISQSPTDVGPVFESIAESVRRLCSGTTSAVLRYDGELINLAALSNINAEGTDALRQAFPRPPSRATTTTRAILTGQITMIADVLEDPDYALKGPAQTTGFRSALAVPMLREGKTIGGISVMRSEPGPFSQREIELLQTFADQAVIAIENVRLFTELQEKNRALTEAHALVTESLEQQTATSEILGVISRSPSDVQPVFDTIVGSATRLCHAVMASVLLTDGQMLYLPANYGSSPEALSAVRARFPRPLDRQTLSGAAILARSVVHVPDVQELSVPEFTRQTGQMLGYRSLVAVPMVREGEVVGALNVCRREPGRFSDAEVELLKTFAHQAVIAIENVRLFNETKDALERQTATSEILQIISSSPTSLQPVFDIIATNARRLCSASYGQVQLYDGERIRLAALDNVDPEGADAIRHGYPLPVGEGSLGGRVIGRRAVVQIPNLRDDAAYEYKRSREASGLRSLLGVPMLRDGEPIGTIAVGRPQTGLFSDTHVELLQTFADQAVIAIENVRLFKELEERNRELTEILDRQTSTADILRVISRSPTDIQQVFDTIVRSASRLCAGHWAAALRFDGELIHLAAQHNIGLAAAEFEDLFPCSPSRRLPLGRAILERELVHIADAAADPDIESGVIRRARSFLVAPMLREGAPIGAIAVSRPNAGPFPPSHIELLRSFADQAVIAIENVRLFKELQEKNRALTQANAQVTESLEQRTATSEILRVISSSPTDVQPVFDAIAQSAMRLCGADIGAVYQFDGELFDLVAHRNFTPESLETLRRKAP